jgi:ribosomal protein L37AE/L43A
MDQPNKLPEWSPRIPKHKVRRLYQLDSQGIQDEVLVDEVGFTFLSRCKSFIDANRAVRGEAPCPICSRIIVHGGRKEELLTCQHCGWEANWGAYFSTIQKKQLSGAEPVINLFEDYVEAFPKSQTYASKMVVIDRLIHGFHWHQKYGATRPVAVNLIEGRLTDVIAFLDALSFGDASTSGIQETRAAWIENSTYARSWGKEKG